MNELQFDYSHSEMDEHRISQMQDEIHRLHKQLHDRTGAGCDFLGWLDVPSSYITNPLQKNELARIQAAAHRIQQQADVLVVIGVGGSCLGAKAAIQMLTSPFYNEWSRERRKGPKIYFVGDQLSSSYLSELLALMEDQDFSVNVVSKSGTTLESAIAFRLFRELLERKYGKSGAAKRIFVTTDQEKGSLKQLANGEGYETFTIADDIGGRYSVLTAVGLLPIATVGINIEQLLAGAAHAEKEYANPNLMENACYQYATLRHYLYRSGKTIEILATYEPCMHAFSEWWKQLFGESEGKGRQGVFPTSMQFTSDLHSLGQYVQDGERQLFETVLYFERSAATIEIRVDGDSDGVGGDGLAFLTGRRLEDVNRKAFEGTLLAHTDGGVPNLLIQVPECTPYWFGHLVYFFEKACAISGYLLGINPFDQPGVEAYKKNMLALLGKPGFELQKQQLEARLGYDRKL